MAGFGPFWAIFARFLPSTGSCRQTPGQGAPAPKQRPVFVRFSCPADAGRRNTDPHGPTQTHTDIAESFRVLFSMPLPPRSRRGSACTPPRRRPCFRRAAVSQMSVSVRVGPCWSAWLFRCVSDTSRTPRRCVPPEADRLLPKQPQSRAAVAMARQRPTKHEAQRTTHKAQRIFAPSTWHLPPRRLAAAIFLPPEWTFSRTW